MTPRAATRAQALAAVAELAARRPTETLWVGLDGRGASGKSTLAAVIAASVPRAVVVHVDDFSSLHLPEWDRGRFRAQVAEPLSAGRPARYQRWDWDVDAGADWHEVAPGSLVVVEGVSSTRADAGVQWDLAVWVDAPREVRLRRALERDGLAMMGRWLDDWIPSEEAYIARERPQDRVDLVVDGTREVVR